MPAPLTTQPPARACCAARPTTVLHGDSTTGPLPRRRRRSSPSAIKRVSFPSEAGSWSPVHSRAIICVGVGVCVRVCVTCPVPDRTVITTGVCDTARCGAVRCRTAPCPCSPRAVQTTRRTGRYVLYGGWRSFEGMGRGKGGPGGVRPSPLSVRAPHGACLLLGDLIWIGSLSLARLIGLLYLSLSRALSRHGGVRLVAGLGWSMGGDTVLINYRRRRCGGASRPTRVGVARSLACTSPRAVCTNAVMLGTVMMAVPWTWRRPVAMEARLGRMLVLMKDKRPGRSASDDTRTFMSLMRG